MMRRVTDPEILKQLNSDQPQYKRVTDPAILKQLNNQSEKSILQFEERPGMREEQQKALSEFAQNASQSIINTPEEVANVFGKHLYNKFNYAPQNTEASQLGKVSGDIASYFMPSGAISGGLKGLNLIPKAKNAIDAMSAALKAKPFINALLQSGKNAGEAALFQKEKYPNSNAKDVVEAAGIGAGIPFAMNMFTSTNPIVSTLAKLGVGGGLGYSYNGIPGALKEWQLQLLFQKH